MKSTFQNISCALLIAATAVTAQPAQAATPGTLSQTEVAPNMLVECYDGPEKRWSLTVDINLYLGMLSIPVASDLQGDDHDDVQMLMPGDIAATLACTDPDTYNSLFGPDADLDFPQLFD